MYSWGLADSNLIKRVIKESKEPEKNVAAKIEDLGNSLLNGIEDFKKEIKHNQQLHRICSEHIEKIYCSTNV